MVIAKGTVYVGERRYTEGETVFGLSQSDITRMEREGFVEVREDTREVRTKKPAKTKGGK